MKWVFISLSKHPEINQLSAVTPEVELETNRAVGNLVTRLMTDDCGAELKAMAQEHGVSSISNAFEVFGRVAMMELMADPKVGSAMSSIEQFIDSERIQEALQLQ